MRTPDFGIAERNVDSDRAPPSVALVDDDASLEGVFRTIVTDAPGSGSQLRQSTTGRSALDAFARDEPDMVVLDLKLPDIDGLTVLRGLKQHARLRDVPVLMLTANDAWTAVQTAMDAGADAYHPRA